MMKLFWYWISERQEIFMHRYIEKLDPPWTDDKIFQEYKFTNVFRELDRGTIHYKEKILDYWVANWDRHDAPEKFLFETLIYRHFNYIFTWEAIEDLIRNIDKDLSWQQRLYEKLDKLDRVYTNAHNVTGVQWGGYSRKINNTIYLINHWKKIVHHWSLTIFKTKSMQECFNYVRDEIMGCGGFTSYEVVCDFSYLPDNIIPWDDNQWANAGPGCRRGLNRIFPNFGDNQDDCQRAIKFLRDYQGQFLNEYELPFYEYPGKLTMRAIEHSLCEFSKYAKAYLGEGRPRNKYRGTEPGMKELVYKNA